MLPLLVLTLLGAVNAVLFAVAPLTKTDKDNKVAAFLRKVEDLLHKVVPAKPER